MISNFRKQPTMDFLTKQQLKVLMNLYHIKISYIDLQKKITAINKELLIVISYFIVLRKDLLSEKDDVKKSANENKGGPYDPEIYRIPKQNIKDPLVSKDVTDQLLNGALALDTPGMTKNQSMIKHVQKDLNRKSPL